MKDNTRRDADPTTNKDVQGKFTGGSEGSGWVEAETMVRHAISRMNSERDKPVKTIPDRDAYSPDPWNRKKFIDCEKCVKKIPANNYITHLVSSFFILSFMKISQGKNEESPARFSLK